MDKLQPILKHHFWILLVPLLSMNLWGYFSANSALKAATTARQGELDQVKNGIPAGTTDPNASYSEELKKTNDVLVSYVDKELLDLWNRQKARMVWPARVAADIPKVYKSEIKSSKIRLAYQKDYPAFKKQVYETVEPYVLDRKGITWTPKVDFPIEFINPYVKFTNLAVESQVMWEAQEDLWLTQLILEAIREVNKDADSESSAMIRRVVDFRLLGGNGESPLTASAEGGNGGFDDDSGEMGMPRPQMAMNAAIQTSVRFDPSEEFGTGGDPSMMNAGMGGMAGMAGLLGGGGDEMEEVDPEAPTGPLRYVKEDEAAPYVERGFYLSVIINQNNLVDFLVALSNSEWPIHVVRFHFGRNPYGGPDEFASRGVANAAPIGGGMTNLPDDDQDGKGSRRGGGGMMSRPMAMPRGGGGIGDGEGGFGLGRGGLGGGLGGGMPGMAPSAGNSGYPPDALLHPDLVQLDLAGLITMYRQPKSEIPEEGATPEGEAAPADGSPDAAEGEMAAEEPASPAKEGAEAADSAAAKPGEPAEKAPGAEAKEGEEAAASDEFADAPTATDPAAGDKPAAADAAAGAEEEMKDAPGTETPAKPEQTSPAADASTDEGDPAADAGSDEFASPPAPAAPDKPSEPPATPEAPAAPEKPSSP